MHPISRIAVKYIFTEMEVQKVIICVYYMFGLYIYGIQIKLLKPLYNHPIIAAIWGISSVPYEK